MVSTCKQLLIRRGKNTCFSLKKIIIIIIIIIITTTFVMEKIQRKFHFSSKYSILADILESDEQP